MNWLISKHRHFLNKGKNASRALIGQRSHAKTKCRIAEARSRFREIFFVFRSTINESIRMATMRLGVSGNCWITLAVIRHGIGTRVSMSSRTPGQQQVQQQNLAEIDPEEAYTTDLAPFVSHFLLNLCTSHSIVIQLSREEFDERITSLNEVIKRHRWLTILAQFLPLLFLTALLLVFILCFDQKSIVIRSENTSVLMMGGILWLLSSALFMTLITGWRRNQVCISMHSILCNIQYVLVYSLKRMLVS